MNSRYLQFGIILVILALGIFAGRAEAATFYFSPPAGKYSSGDLLRANLYMDTEGQAVNAAEATISFPTRFLTVESISMDGSVFKFWSEEPKFSNSSGNITFGGGLPSPGVSSPSARVLSVNFRATGGGLAVLQVTTGAILANDGSGTNVLTGSRDGQYTIVLGEAPAEAPPEPQEDTLTIAPVTDELPGKPAVKSLTHPDQDSWYGHDAVKLSWDLPAGVTGINYAWLDSANHTLSNTSKGIASETSFDLRGERDGVKYFYLRLRNGNGWGPQARRTVRIDRTSPLPFALEQVASGDPTDPRPLFDWETKDETSGVSRYEIKIGDGDWFPAEPLRTDLGYRLPLQAPGIRDIAVRAYDEAGNMREEAAMFEIRPLPLPVISEYSERITSEKGVFIARGDAPPLHKVQLTLTKNGSVVVLSAKANADGHWSAVYRDRLEPGAWTLVAQTLDERGALSGMTAGLPVRVEGWLGRTLPYLAGWGLIGLIGALMIAGLMILVLYLIHRIRMWRVLLRKDLRNLQEELRADLFQLERELGPLTEGGAKKKKAGEQVRKRAARIKKDVSDEIEKLDRLAR